MTTDPKPPAHRAPSSLCEEPKCFYFGSSGCNPAVPTGDDMTTDPATEPVDRSEMTKEQLAELATRQALEASVAAENAARAEAATVAAQLAELEHKYARLVSVSSDDARRLVSARDAAEAQLAEVRAESERYRGLANEAGDSVLAERDAAEAREAELRGLLESMLRFEACVFKKAHAWLADHPIALPKEPTPDIPETKEPR